MTRWKFTFKNKNAMLRGILAVIFFIFMNFVINGAALPILGLILQIGFTIMFYRILNRWLLPDRDATTGPNARSNDLEGVVRGFKESRQPGGFLISAPNSNSDVIVWSYQLERHSETEERLDPIPVEMRGRFFSGYINEGNVVKLYEPSWNGGIIRTKRVYNVTFKEDIMAQMPWDRTAGKIAYSIVIIFFILVISLFISLVFGWHP